jgi:GntR family transcriptional regulator, transcriptional repressor for pyruvate dehydrogenase complex
MKDAHKTVAPRTSFRPVRRSPLVDEVIRQLRSRFASGEFKIGDRLPTESTLVEELGVGRTTIREAMRVLAHSGMVEVLQGSGTFLRSIGDSGVLASRLRQARVLEVMEVRRALELEMTRMAAAYRTDAALAAIRDTLNHMRQSLNSGDEQAFVEADLEMYRILAGETRNSIMIEIHASFAEALRLALTQVVGIPGVMINCLGRHKQLFEAIVARDPDRAEKIVKEHLERVMRLIQDVLGDARVTEAGRGRFDNKKAAKRSRV